MREGEPSEKEERLDILYKLGYNDPKMKDNSETPSAPTARTTSAPSKSK
jgi:hypothetical protein